ncbi:MAG: DUF3106 domain-containing protein, partial [Pseudomonadota bacterium]
MTTRSALMRAMQRRIDGRQWLAAVCLVMAMAFSSSAAFAQDDAPGWDGLSEQQRTLLAPLQSRWSELPAEQRQRLASGAARWDDMTPEQKARARQRFDQWQSLPQDRRNNIRRLYQRWRELPPEERRA